MSEVIYGVSIDPLLCFRLNNRPCLHASLSSVYIRVPPGIAKKKMKLPAEMMSPIIDRVIVLVQNR